MHHLFRTRWAVGACDARTAGKRFEQHVRHAFVIGGQNEQFSLRHPRIGIAPEAGYRDARGKTLLGNQALELGRRICKQHEAVRKRRAPERIEQQVVSLLRSKATHVNQVRLARQIRLGPGSERPHRGRVDRVVDTQDVRLREPQRIAQILCHAVRNRDQVAAAVDLPIALQAPPGFAGARSAQELDLDRKRVGNSKPGR